MLILNLDPNWPYAVNAKGGKNLLVGSGGCAAEIPPHATLDAKQFVFSGGEVHIKLDTIYKTSMAKEIMIRHRINNSQNLMELLLAADAVRRQFPNTPLNAFIPYIPYARQDRPMVEGEPFSLKVFSNILKTANFNTVYTLDPHSDVAPALIDNLHVVRPRYLRQAAQDIRKQFGDFVLVAPDGGALKKIYKQAKYIGYKGEILFANKIRDVSNGKILDTTIQDPYNDPILNEGFFQTNVFWIMDDICDGGRTFIELAKLLKRRGANRVVLSVSHAIISHGEEELRKHIDKIYSTVSIKNDESDLIKRYEV